MTSNRSSLIGATTLKRRPRACRLSPLASEQEQQQKHHHHQQPQQVLTSRLSDGLPAQEEESAEMRRSMRNQCATTSLGARRIRAASIRQGARGHLNRMSTAYTTKQTLFWLSGTLLLVSSLVCANYAPLHQVNQHQPLEQHPASSEAAAYGAQSGQQQPAKAKKIQIVYIKVPLNKLKPSLPADGVEHAAAATAPNNYTSYAASNQHYNSTAETKPQGSQSASQSEQQQLSASRSHQPSFLIPMAVISSADNETPTLNQVQHQQQLATSSASSASHNEEVLVRTGRRSPAHRHQSPMQLYQQQLWQASPPVATSGFMSSFLQAEKERLTSAALRLQPADQPASSNTHLTTTNANNNQNHQNHKPGGLMPVMMVPYSHMPDNMIGQAYNAAVGQALPLESGSPGSILGSPASLSHNTANNNNALDRAQGKQYGLQQSASNSLGGEHGTAGDSSYSHSTGSTGFYGSTGPRQPDASSSGSAYQHSAFGSAGSGPSSGYGSGINSFGASVAFTDFPAALSSASNGYGQLHSSSSNNNLYNSHPSNQLSESPDSTSLEYGKLRQAKKTIIPIVVQVEHAIMESNALAHNLGKQVAASVQAATNAGNRYAGLRAHRQLGALGARQRGYRQQHGKQLAPPSNQQLYGSASNEVAIGGGEPIHGSAPQYINAANAQDVNQITAAINAENAASAAAALAQADMALGQGGPAYIAQPSHMSNGPARPMGGQQNFHPGNRPQPFSNYASGLQSAASALLANTHPMLQAAASGGLASVTKLGAKLGEMIALPSMQMAENPIAALPSAFSSLTNQMGAQLNQAVQQVAKEYPTGAFARQVAQLNQAGMQLAYGSLGSLLPQKQSPQGNQYFGNPNQQQQLLQAAGSQQSSSILSSPQSHIQNLKLSIGQNLQSAAAQMLGPQKTSAAQNAAATLLANPLSALYPPVVNSALKTMSGGLAMAASQSASPSFALPGAEQQQQQQQPLPQQQQLLAQGSVPQQQQVFQAGSEINQPLGQQNFSPEQQQQAQLKPAGKTSLKSKFLSFFQPPKFISNLLNWNDHASSRNDQVSETATESVSEAEKSSKSQASSVEAKDAKVDTAAAVEAKNSSDQTKSLESASSPVASVAAASSTSDAADKQKKD